MTLEWKSISSTITIQLCFFKQRQYDLLSWNQKAAMDEKEFRWARKKNHTPVLGQKIICIKQIPSLHIVLHLTEMLWLHGWEKRDRKGKRKHNHINPLITVVSIRVKKKKLFPTLPHSPESHIEEGISFICSASIPSPWNVFFIYSGEEYFIFISPRSPGVTLAKGMELGQEHIQPLVSFFLEPLPPETSILPWGTPFWSAHWHTQTWGNIFCAAIGSCLWDQSTNW